MPKIKRDEPVMNFDRLIKEIISRNDLATIKDLDKVHQRLEKIETSLRKGGSARPLKQRVGANSSATEMVLNAVRENKKGADFKAVKAHTGFADNKIRNILFRLSKLGKIARRARGVYTTE